ncbi:crotonase/enoyl-CoA hydratase family protein [Nocardioides sp. ChNu-153]|uniref:crotonase/enoyl-CoA hydratase family protein n=1 Tax=unclassified Nocardioides TaxID=2615069 RepID=UPI002406A161|nr:MULTISPECIES: crotonase/enoyl-CoA hydratase family protein [unclassified Nocardioides]MDF9715911.1 crotonase/enoyl-CoA hydratase family protein [Nocardioides sp. ChNu-99]MDN7121014.1 crotonase/enoyl-CoA hydratase family protein [Nocardioides sp. ChNu-153]
MRASSPTTTYVTCTVENGVAHVRLARPDKLNALTLETLDDLIRTARWLRTDRSLRAVVISGEGDSFCAGLDFGSVMRKPAAIAAALLPSPLRGTNKFQEACWAWRRVPVPVIAAVHGHCYGGGLQIALAADFRIATPDSRWSVLEGKWGLIPDMSGVRSISELVGIDVAKKLTMTAEVISGKEARDLGLVTELDPEPVAAAEALAETLRTKSPDAIAAAKRLFDGAQTSSARRTFGRERIEQVLLLATRNARVARESAFAKITPSFGPRSR